MSIAAGKKKNWGSRSGRSAVSKKSNTHYTYLSELPTEILLSVSSSDAETQSAIYEIVRRRKSLVSAAKPKLKFETPLGKLFQGDCNKFFEQIDDNSIDCIFADPPFNLRKDYEGSAGDNLSEGEYLDWTRGWLESSCAKLKTGGSLFVYNIPKWAIPTASFLQKKLVFKHWIAIDSTFSMPIPGRLYPSHYALLYFVKGAKPNVFNPPRLPIKTCSRCGQEQNDYGGYKMKMNPKGINIRDVWSDIPPVRHAKYKNRDANELHLKLLDRILDISTNEGDLVFDPFGGSGTTYVAAELKKRRWLGVELGNCAPILERFASLTEERNKLNRYRNDINILFTDKALKLRIKSGLPIDNYRIEQEQLDRILDSSFGNNMRANLDL